ncbi:MAG: hypothetical protein MUP47_03750 [Phycisphaerae bacterium]|nr:hypothetical protein [Phycisphaerae bacterium]
MDEAAANRCRVPGCHRKPTSRGICQHCVGVLRDGGRNAAAVRRSQLPSRRGNGRPPGSENIQRQEAPGRSVPIPVLAGAVRKLIEALGMAPNVTILCGEQVTFHASERLSGALPSLGRRPADEIAPEYLIQITQLKV